MIFDHHLDDRCPKIGGKCMATKKKFEGMVDLARVLSGSA
jgi:hypothetical protein